MGDDGAKVKGIVESVFKGLDETISEYMVSVLSDDPHQSVSLRYLWDPGWSGAALDEMGNRIGMHVRTYTHPMPPPRPRSTDRPTIRTTHKH